MKKIAKKLALNAETLKNLDAPRLDAAAGGDTVPGCSATQVCSGCHPCR